MRRYTTPTHELTVVDADLSGCDVYVSYKQGSRTREVMVEPVLEGEDTHLSVPWTQEETALFNEGMLQVQVNWITPEGLRTATEVGQVQVGPNLLAREVEFGG